MPRLPRLPRHPLTPDALYNINGPQTQNRVYCDS